MNPISTLKKALSIDYGNLDEKGKEYVYCQFIDQCLGRIHWVTAVAFFGEIILMLLDFSSGFFSQNPWNKLNLLAELLIIISSLCINLACRQLIYKTPENYTGKQRTVFLYKLCLFLSVGMFIFTDVYVRHRPLGAYIVFLFVFQVAPFYRAFLNFYIFAAYGTIVFFTYLCLVPNTRAGSLFSVTFIFVAFCLSTEFLRAFFVKAIVRTHMNELSTQRFETLTSQTILALSDAVEAKDLYTKGHSQRVAKYSKELARRMGYDEQKLEETYYIGLLHDIGKIGVHDNIINKNGRLTDEEFAEIKRHPEMGYEILKKITELPSIGLGARWHHEKYDGTGYPDRLKGENIPEIARIIAVADAYDAMTSKRSYRDTLPQAVVRGEIEKNLGKQFDPEIGKLMLDMIDEDKEYNMKE